MRIRTILSTMMAAVLLLTAFKGAVAQLPDAPDVRAEAAAMTLTSEDLPTGFMLTGETFLDVPDPTIVPGVDAHYVSVYTNTDTGLQIRSYVYLFESEEQATDGIEVIEGNQPDTLSDSALELGSGNAELTVGTYEDISGRTIGTADATFLRGNVVAGVAVDDPAGEVPDGDLATDLAQLKDDRIQQVQAGESDIDLELTTQLVPFAEGGLVIQAGFLSPVESEAIYGTQGSPLSGLGSSWVQTVAYGEEGAPPRVTIGVTTFDSPEEAADVVQQADRIFQPLADQQRIEGAQVDGADSTVAFSYTSRSGQIADQDSYRIIFSQGDTVTVVDVQDAPDSATAESAANAIASSQITCQAEGACEVPVAPGVIPGT